MKNGNVASINAYILPFALIFLIPPPLLIIIISIVVIVFLLSVCLNYHGNASIVAVFVVARL